MNHEENIDLDGSTRRALETYRSLGLKANVLNLLRRHYALTDEETSELLHLAHLNCGRTWKRPDGEPYVLTESMRDYWRDRGREDICRSLTEKGLVTRESSLQNRTYYWLTPHAWELLEFDDRRRYDLGEKIDHQRAVSLLRTFYSGLLDLASTPYAHLERGDCDLLVYPESHQARERLATLGQHGRPPGHGTEIACEVTTDHHHTQRVLDHYDDFQKSGVDCLWVFSTRRVMNKWLRRLQLHNRLPYDYASGPTTPIQIAQQRVLRLDDPAIRYVTTVKRVEQWIREFPRYQSILVTATPLHHRDSRYWGYDEPAGRVQ